jgi:hypothetical protein
MTEKMVADICMTIMVVVTILGIWLTVRGKR